LKFVLRVVYFHPTAGAPTANEELLFQELAKVAFPFSAAM
jgi:hypothetical protein